MGGGGLVVIRDSGGSVVVVDDVMCMLVATRTTVLARSSMLHACMHAFACIELTSVEVGLTCVWLNEDLAWCRNLSAWKTSILYEVK